MLAQWAKVAERLIHLRQHPSFGTHTPALADSLGANVAAGWSESAKPRQITGKATDFATQIEISSRRKLADAHPHDSPLNKPWRVQIQNEDHPHRRVV